jgi:hypothetical protein
MPDSPIHRGWRRDAPRNTLDVVVSDAPPGRGTPTYDKISGPSPLVYDDSTTQLYDLGTRLSVDERVYRYSRAGGALQRWDGASNNDAWSLTNEAPNQSAAIGATSIQVVNTTGTADQFKGGWVAIFTNRLQVRRILGNDASDGTDILLYLDGGLEAAIVADTTWVTGYPSIYYDTRQISTEFASVVCVPNAVIASGSYYWGQTWGPCYGRVIGTVPGVTSFDREVYFGGNGSLYGHIEAEAAAAGGYQRAGYLLPKTSGGGGDQLYMLQLAP